MIYIKYKTPDDDGFTIWEMPSDLSMERCIYISNKQPNINKDWKPYTEDTVWHDLDNNNIAQVVTWDQAILEMI
jgi:hypothetical protein